MSRRLRIEMPDSFSPAAARPASTLLLLRPSAVAPFDIYLTVRHAAMDFLPGAIVFPGGRTEDGDSAPEILARTRGLEALPPGQAGLRVGAIREAFEECGVLLARPRGTEAMISGARVKALAPARAALNAGILSFGAFLEAEELELATELLTQLSRWVTPWWHHKRFDTRFFLAPLPPGQEAQHDGRESVESLWVDPMQILTRQDKWRLLIPTRANLDALKDSPSLEAALSQHYPDAEEEVAVWLEPRADGFAMCARPSPGGPEFELPVKGLSDAGAGVEVQAKIKAWLAGQGWPG